jgi:hypothetical protein
MCQDVPPPTMWGSPLAGWKLQYRCASWPSCQSAACRLVQSREPTTGIIVIDIHARRNCADTINNLSGLIEFKKYLGQMVEIAVWMRAHHERNLWFGESDFNCRFHRACSSSRTSLIQPFACFFVASTARSDLLFCAKHLFVAPDRHGCSQLRPSADATTATLALIAADAFILLVSQQ